jgi:hypothetical protein
MMNAKAYPQEMNRSVRSRNLREGFYQGMQSGHHRRGERRTALRPICPYLVDESRFGDGPWLGEPSSLHFKTAEGFDAVILRARHSGALLGYVGVPASHPWHGKQYHHRVTATREQLEQPVDTDKLSFISMFTHALSDHDSNEVSIDCLIRVHGGLTYSDRGYSRIGEDPRYWYFGFDCAHYRDLCPAYQGFTGDGTYRDIGYVKAEIAALSRQLAAVVARAEVPA